MRYAKDGEPFDVWVMRNYHWLPHEVAAMPNRVFLELLAAERLAAERQNRPRR